MSMLKREPKSLDKIQRRPPPKKKPSSDDEESQIDQIRELVSGFSLSKATMSQSGDGGLLPYPISKPGES